MKHVWAVAPLLLTCAIAWGQSPSSLGPVLPGTSAAALSCSEAWVLGNKHLQRPTTAGCFLEDRNACWFVAPPYLGSVETERAGVYVLKFSGRVLPFYPIDAPVFEGLLPAGGISAEQAKAIAQQFRGQKPAEAFREDDPERREHNLKVKAHGNYWVCTPIAIKSSIYYYVDRYTGKVTREIPEELPSTKRKKGR
jgi:hypothetical protein